MSRKKWYCILLILEAILYLVSYGSDVSMILWTRFGRIVSNQRRCPNESKIYQRVQGNNCSIA